MSFKLIDHTADVAVIVEGNSLEEIFISACQAWKFVTIDSVSEKIESSKKLIFNSSNYEILLSDLLTELNFQLLIKKWVFISIKNILLQELNSSIQLEVEIFGEKFDPNKHHIKEEIKAVTFHQMKIEKVDNHFETKIIFDI